MKKILNGKLYDTDTATEIGSWTYSHPGDFNYIKETLYRKQTGEFFLYACGGANTQYSKELSYNEWCSGSAFIREGERDFDPREWVETYLDADTYISLFGEVAE